MRKVIAFGLLACALANGSEPACSSLAECAADDEDKQVNLLQRAAVLSDKAADSVKTKASLQTARTESEQEESEKIEEVEMLGENASLQAGADCQNAKKCDDTGVKCRHMKLDSWWWETKKCKNCEFGSKCTDSGKCECQNWAQKWTSCKPNQDYHERGYCRGYTSCWDRVHDDLVKCRDCPTGAVREDWTGDSYPYQCEVNYEEVNHYHRCLCCDAGAMNFPTDGVWGCKNA